MARGDGRGEGVKGGAGSSLAASASASLSLLSHKHVHVHAAWGGREGLDSAGDPRARQGPLGAQSPSVERRRSGAGGERENGQTALDCLAEKARDQTRRAEPQQSERGDSPRVQD